MRNGFQPAGHGAEQAEDLAGVDRKRQRIHRRERAEAAGQVFDFEDNVAHAAVYLFSTERSFWRR